MTVYIILALLIALFSLYPYSKHNSIRSRIVFLFLSFSAMVLVLGLRASSVGEDTSMYMGIFNKAQLVNWKDILANICGRTVFYTYSYGYQDTIESLYLGLCKIIGLFTENPQVFLFMIAAITCALYAKFIFENTEHVVYATWIFLCEAIYMFAFNCIRQLLAISIALQAYKYLKKKQYINSAAILVLAFLIHNTSVICLLIIPIILLPKKYEKRFFKYMLIGSIVLPISISASSGIILRFLPRYAGYFSTNYWTNSIGGSSILWVIELCLVFYSYNRRFPTKDSFKLSSFIVIYLSLELMGLSITMFSRVAYFYRSFLLLFLPDAVTVIKPKYRLIIKMGIILLLLFVYIANAKSPARNYIFFFDAI